MAEPEHAELGARGSANPEMPEKNEARRPTASMADHDDSLTPIQQQALRKRWDETVEGAGLSVDVTIERWQKDIGHYLDRAPKRADAAQASTMLRARPRAVSQGYRHTASLTAIERLEQIIRTGDANANSRIEVMFSLA